jgi:hypothetical protein
MTQLVPLLMMGNNEIEVMMTSSRDGGGMLPHGSSSSSSSKKIKKNSLDGKTKKEEMDGKYLSSIGMFQTDDILSCNDQLGRMIYNNSSANSSSGTSSSGTIHNEREFVERSKHVVKCLEGRAKELLDMFTDAKQRSSLTTQQEGDANEVNTCEEQAVILNSAIEQLRKLSVELDSCEEQQVLDMTVI